MVYIRLIYLCTGEVEIVMPNLYSTLLLGTLSAAATAKQAPYLVNITAGHILPGIGGVGGEVICRRTVDSPDCSVKPRQLVDARDFAVDPTGRYLYVATYGINYIGQCFEEDCKNLPTHDNSSRLVAFDMKYPNSDPVTLSFCGPWQAVEYDAARDQVVALRHPKLKSDEHGTHVGVEVVAFDAKFPVRSKHIFVTQSFVFSGSHNTPLLDSHPQTLQFRNILFCTLFIQFKPGVDDVSKECFLDVPLGDDIKTCGCAMGYDPKNLNGRVIARKGLKADFDYPAATMELLGDSVVIGDQNNYCVVSFPLDGSAGATQAGTPVAGTCGESCHEQGCASIGSPSVPAGKKLGDGNRGLDLTYELFKTRNGRLLLHDMNTETIDYGKQPKAKTMYKTIPVEPRGSSVYLSPVIDPNSGDMLLVEKFSLSIQRLTYGMNEGYGNATVTLNPQMLQGYFLDISVHGSTVMTPIQGVPRKFVFLPKTGQRGSGIGGSKAKALVLVSVALRMGGGILDNVFLELDI